MSKKNSRSRILGVLTILALLAGAEPAWSHGFEVPRLLELVPAAVRAWFQPALRGRKGLAPAPTKCGITIDPNGCPPPPSCAGCGGQGTPATGDISMRE